MLEVHAILQRQRCNENITKKTGTLSDAYNIFTRFITKCPCCKKSFTNDNPAVGGHVLAEYGRLNTEGRLIYTKCITPICKECNDSYKNHQALKVFKVRGYHLCRVPNKPPKR